MRRILEKLWASAQERVASLPNAPRLLARARASLGMPAIGDSEETADVAGVTGTARGGRQGSRGMKEELSNSKRRQQVQGGVDGGGGVGVKRGAGDARSAEAQGGKGRATDSSTHSSEQQQQQEPQSSTSHFLGTYVFLEEFLKELFCALSAKNGVESDAQGLSESHRQGSAELHTGMLSVDGEASPKPPGAGRRGGRGGGGGGGKGFSGEGEAGGGGEAENEEDIDELPTSLDELLKEAAFPTFVSPPVLC